MQEDSPSNAYIYNRVLSLSLLLNLPFPGYFKDCRSSKTSTHTPAPSFRRMIYFVHNLHTNIYIFSLHAQQTLMDEARMDVFAIFRTIEDEKTSPGCH